MWPSTSIPPTPFMPSSSADFRASQLESLPTDWCLSCAEVTNEHGCMKMRIPCVICGLRLDNGSNSKHDACVEYESGNAIRDHLVERHSKYVSRALLAPDLNNKTHFWLLTNVDYSAASNSINAVNSATNPLLDESMGAAFLLNTLLSTVQPALDTKNMWADLLNSETLNTLLNGCMEEAPSTNTTSDESLEEQHSSNSFTNSRSDGLIDSKAMRKATCQICNVKVCSTARQRHVYLIHLKQPDMFMCSACDYTNSNSIWEMRKHCVAQHGGDAAVAISNEEKHKDIIQKWNQKCFPDWKQKKTNGWWKDEKNDEPIDAEFDQNFESKDKKPMCKTINSPITIQRGVEVGSVEATERSPTEGSNVATSSSSVNGDAEYVDYNEDDGIDGFSGRCSSVTDSVADSREISNTKSSAHSSNDRICHLCWEESRYPGRHIAQKHLKKPLYECPVCANFGSYESCTVAKHILKVHPDTEETQPISNLEKYADEIRDLQTRCFPNRPMKLVRAHVGSRPRERHHCRLCDTLVAQSDRQRHVYHRHLQRSRIFECPLCDFASNYDVHRVKWHIKWIHKDATPSGMEPISHENEYREEIDALNEECFPGWQHRKRPFWWLEGEENGTHKASTAQEKQKSGIIQDEPVAKKSYIEEGNREIFVVKKNLEPIEKTTTSNIEQRLDWTCQLCLKEFKPSSNFLRHVAKDHLNIPLYQCPICKGHGGQDAYEVRSHMLRVHGNSDMDPISNVEANVEQIQKVYQECFPGRKFKNLGIEKKLNHDIKTYDEPRVQCKECGMEMKTEDRQIHVYRHHLKEPRLYECPLCDFSHHACSSDVKAHIKYVHRDNSDAMPKANLILFSNEIQFWNDRCFPGWINRRLPTAAIEDFNRCRLCDVEVRQTSRHIAEVHLMIPLHQCPLCEYGAAESRLVKRHMKNNHKKKDIKGLDPIANVVEHRASFSALHDQCFPGRPKRLSNITISEEGRRAKCKQCGLTISKKRRLAHLLERHMKKIIFKCPHCSFNSTHDSALVESHIEENHSGLNKRGHPVSEISKHLKEIRELAKNCFNDSEFKII